MRKQSQTNCESYGNYVYDKEYGYYVCETDLDGDEMVGFPDSQSFQCPYYQLDDEYRIMQKQM